MNKDLCRIGSDLSFKQWLRWPTLGLLGLFLLTLLTRCNSIENDIQQRTQQQLDSEGMTWATTDLDGHGRDVVLTGEAPSEASKTDAIKLVEGIHGVRTVSHDISIKQYVSSTFLLSQNNKQILLSGTLPDQESIDDTLSKAREIYGEDNVVSELAVSDNASAPKWLASAIGIMAAMKGAEAFSMDASDDALNIGGIVESEETKAQLLAQANNDFNNNVTEAIQVIKKGPTPEELAAEAARLAETQRLAEEKRLAADLEAQKLAEQQRLAEQAHIAEIQRLAWEAEKVRSAEIEALRLAEEQRLAAEAKAEQERLAKLEALRLAKEKQLAAEAKAEEVRLAKLEALRLAEEKRLAALNYQRELLMACQKDLNQLVSNKAPFFYENTDVVRGASYPIMAMLALKINACSDILHQTHRYIDLQATAPEDDLAKARLNAVISYLENINGAHRGLLRESDSKSETSHETSELYFTISK